MVFLKIEYLLNWDYCASHHWELLICTFWCEFLPWSGSTTWNT